jgi:Phosphotransferase enzyme family
VNADLVREIVLDDPVRAQLNGGGDWERVYGRMSADGAVLVYEDGGRPETAIAATLSGNDIALRRWSEDPALPALCQLLRDHAEAKPVRYRPGKRCTLRKGDLFLKCVADDRGAAINRDARLLWSAKQQGALDFGVARPGGWLPSLRMMVQHKVAGTAIIATLKSSEGRVLARSLGAANASLAAAPISPPERFTYADQMKRTGKYAKRLTKYLPRTASALDQLMAELAHGEPGKADRPTHGAPHAHQWLDGPDGLQLVDFDRFGLGDPEVDVATFMAEADFEDWSDAAEIGAAYQDGFSKHWPLDPELIRAYRVHKHIAKALRATTAIRLDAEERALAILAGAQSLMEARP